MLGVLFELSRIRKTNSDVGFGGIFVGETLGEMLSQGVAGRFALCGWDRGEKVVGGIVLEKKDMSYSFVEPLLSFFSDERTLFDCLMVCPWGFSGKIDVMVKDYCVWGGV